MKQPTRRTVLGTLAIAGAVILSACGASGGSDAGKDAKDTTTAVKTTTTTKAPATTTTVVSAEAQARADSVDLTVSDFPDGWTASAPSPDDPNNPLKACDPTFRDDSTKLAKHSTDDFTLGSLDASDGTQFSAETVVFASEADADAAVEVFNDPKVISCLDAALKKTFEGAAAGVTVTGSLADAQVDLPTDNEAAVTAPYEISAPDGSKLTASVRILAMRTGDIATMVTILTVGDSLDPTTLKAPVTTLANLQAAA